eukprot:scaffold126201_cov34-Tisochrysis_lutea.AAC.2
MSSRLRVYPFGQSIQYQAGHCERGSCCGRHTHQGPPTHNRVEHQKRTFSSIADGMCERVDEIERMEGGFVVQVKRRASEDDSQKERRGGRWLVSNGHSLVGERGSNMMNKTSTQHDTRRTRKSVILEDGAVEGSLGDTSTRLMPLHTELRPFESEGKGEREEKGERCKDG